MARRYENGSMTMPLFKNKYRVETTRLKNWDYASPGGYFVTICTQGRKCFFGEVVEGKVRLSVIGETAKQFWADIPAHFAHTQLDEYVVMPNHVHGIVHLVATCHGALLQGERNKFGPLKPGSLQSILNAYKSSVTRWCRQNGHAQFAWQARFHDHVIRDEESLNRIRQYILNNSACWERDQNNTGDLWM